MAYLEFVGEPGRFDLFWVCPKRTGKTGLFWMLARSIQSEPAWMSALEYPGADIARVRNGPTTVLTRHHAPAAACRIPSACSRRKPAANSERLTPVIVNRRRLLHKPSCREVVTTTVCTRVRSRCSLAARAVTSVCPSPIGLTIRAAARLPAQACRPRPAGARGPGPRWAGRRAREGARSPARPG